MKQPMNAAGMAVAACAVLTGVVVLGAWQLGQPPHQGAGNVTPKRKTAMQHAGGVSVSGNGAAPEPAQLPATVATPGQGPPPGQEIGGGPQAPGAATAPGTNEGPPNPTTVGGGMPPGGPPQAVPPLGPGEGVVAPETGAPDVGGVLGPGAVPGPGGTPGAYAQPGPEQYWYTAKPNPAEGRNLIVRYGCGTCHSIDPIRDARGLVGPPLTGVASRAYIAGVLQNTVDNRARWIENPQAFVPNVIMPNMGISRAEAEDIAAYLETLR